MNHLLTRIVAASLCTLSVSASCNAAEAASFAKLRMQIGDLELTDQNGKAVHVYRDLIENRVVALNFIFTDCPGICPPLGASFGRVQALLGDQLGDGIGLVTISVNPAGDTPEKLKAWGAKFGAKPGWHLLTDKSGRKDKIDTLLKALKVYTPDFEEHSPFILLLDARNGQIKRVHGSATPAQEISAQLLAMRGTTEQPKEQASPPDSAAPPTAPAPPTASAAAQRYFPDVRLIDQHGEPQRFYTDLIKGKIVVIGSFFASCTGVCPDMMTKLMRLQDSLGDRFGSDVAFVSITVDPLIDTPAALMLFASRFRAKAGWHFLTGSQADVETVLKKLNYAVEVRENHSNILFMGNEPTGLWLKAKGGESAASLATAFKKVLDDKG